jgi:transcription initiation factor TFIIE subunit alpha
MEAAKELLRTAVRTFFTHPKQILLIDAILLHSVLQMEDLNLLLQSQPKDIRALLNPLRSARLIATSSRPEQKVTGARPSSREYYYCPFHPAIDAIKFKIAKLRKKVEALYQQDENTKRKDWRCPRCKAEYEELEILDKFTEEGFTCDRCGAILERDEQAARTNMDKSNHEKIRRLNDQLKKFDAMILKIDRSDIPENDFQSAWDRRKYVPRPTGSGRTDTSESQYLSLHQRPSQTLKKHGHPDLVKSENLTVNLTTSEDQEREEAERRESRKKQLAQQNQLPDWITNTLHTTATSTNNNSSTSSLRNGSGEEEPGPEHLVSNTAPPSYTDEEDSEGDFEDVDVDTAPASIAGTKREHSVAFQEDSDDNEDFEDAV